MVKIQTLGTIALLGIVGVGGYLVISPLLKAGKSVSEAVQGAVQAPLDLFGGKLPYNLLGVSEEVKQNSPPIPTGIAFLDALNTLSFFNELSGRKTNNLGDNLGATDNKNLSSPPPQKTYNALPVEAPKSNIPANNISIGQLASMGYTGSGALGRYVSDVANKTGANLNTPVANNIRYESNLGVYIDPTGKIVGKKGVGIW